MIRWSVPSRTAPWLGDYQVMFPFLRRGQFHVAAFLFSQSIAEPLKEFDQLIARNRPRRFHDAMI